MKELAIRTLFKRSQANATKEEIAYQQRREDFINMSPNDGRMFIEDTSNIVDGEFNVLEPTTLLEPQSPDQE